MSGGPSSSSVKRKRDNPGDTRPDSKAPKLFPIFEKRKAGDEAADDNKPFRWLSPSLGPTRSCLHGVHLAPSPSPPTTTSTSARVAAFDLDGTVIKSSYVEVGWRRAAGGGKQQNRVMKKRQASGLEWEWWRAVVPQKLKEAHNSGFSVVLMSNQSLKPAELAEWKKKIPLIAAAVPELPFRIFAATARDGHRKPMPGMWFELERIFAQDGITIDKKDSYFVGDAAGRADDFASTDRKFALNAGIQFYTPEEYFLKISPAPYTLPGFDVSSVKESPQDSLATTSILPPDPHTEIVLFVGLPGLGKSTFFRTHFAPAGYVHVNQDTLGSRKKCVRAAEEALEAGKSCVIDNTNRDVQTRKYYLDMAKRLQVPARCFVFQGSVGLAWHNNLYRAYARPASLAAREPPRQVLPYMSLTSFESAYETPSVDEGFSEVRDVPWRFEGNEEERRHWNMWLQVDGK